MNYRISIFGNAYQTVGTETSLVKELTDIKIGVYKDSILKCRNALINLGNKDLYTKYKSQLKAVTFCGYFEGGRRISNLISYNNLIVLDIDNLPQDKVEFHKENLINDPYILALWNSPSSLGLKGLVKVNSNLENHKSFFASLSLYFLQQYGIELDKSGSDVTRLCYVSWDPEIFVNLNSIVFTDQIEETEKVRSIKKSDSLTHSVKSVSLAKSAYATEGLNSSKDRIQMKKIIKYLSGKGLSITANFEDWMKVAVIIANTFSYDVGEKYFLSLCRLDLDRHSEHKSKELLKYCYNNRKLNHSNRITFATLSFMAAEKGFNKR